MPETEDETEALKRENAILKFKHESAELIKEVERYKRFLQFALTFVGLGCVAGILTVLSSLDSQVDRQIESQLRKWNDLDVGMGLVRQARWGDALKKLTKAYEQEAHATKSNQEYRSLLYETLVYVLSSTGELIADGTRWQGEDEWNKLIRDSAFRDQFLNRSENEIDETYCNEMFFCTLKFYKEPDLLQRVRGYIQNTLKIVAEDRSKAAHYFDLSMTDLIAGDKNNAKRNYQEATDKDPSTYQDSIKYFNSFKNTVQFRMWDLCAKRFNVDLDSALTGLMHST